MRRAGWIVWLMLALLPLRGWAMAGIGGPQAVHPIPVAAGDETAPATSSMRCHPDRGDAPAGSLCQACDGCHAVMASAPPMPEAGSMAPADAPRIATQRDTGRPVSGALERPPRSVFA